METKEKAIRKAIRINQIVFFLSLVPIILIAIFYKAAVRIFLFGPSMSTYGKYMASIGTLLVFWVGILICSLVLLFLTVSLYEELSDLQIPGRICFLISGVCFPFLVFAVPFLTVITAILSACSWVQIKKARTP